MTSVNRYTRAVPFIVLLGVQVVVLSLALLARDPLALTRTAGRATLILRGGEYLGRSDVVLQGKAHDCGPAVLANLAYLLDVEAPPLGRLSRWAGTSVRGTNFAGLRRAADSMGIRLEARRFVPAYAGSSDLPLIAWVDRQHFVVVTRRAPDGTLTVIDPQIGRYRMPEQRFARLWSGEALVWANGAMERGIRAVRTATRGPNGAAHNHVHNKEVRS